MLCQGAGQALALAASRCVIQLCRARLLRGESSVFVLFAGLSILPSHLAHAQQTRPNPLAHAAVARVTDSVIGSQSVTWLSTLSAYVLGGSADTAQFEFAQGFESMRVLRNGRMLFLDGSQAHFVSATGKLVRTIGRPGDGPAEYRSLGAACDTAADTVLLFDVTLRRISVLDAAGTFVRSIDVSRDGAMDPGSCFDDGRILLATITVGQNKDLELALRIVDRVGKVISNLPRLRLGPALPPPAARGRLSVFVSHDKIYVAFGRPGEVRELRIDGTVARTLSFEDLAAPMKESEWLQLLESALPRNVSAGYLETVRSRFRSLPVPRTWPSFEKVIPDSRAGLWIELSRVSASQPEEWLHFDRTWRLIRRVRRTAGSPGRLGIVGFDDDAAFVRGLDPDGFVTVARRKFETGSADTRPPP